MRKEQAPQGWGTTKKSRAVNPPRRYMHWNDIKLKEKAVDDKK